jgi:uncharacterized protein YukE
MKRLLVLLIIGEAMSALPAMPQISSGGCGNSGAILFVRQIRYVNVLKDYIQQKGAAINDANFVIQIEQLKIDGLQSIIESIKALIKSYASKVASTQEIVKALQSQYPDIKNLSGSAFCQARYAFSMMPPLKFALEKGYMDFDNYFAYSNASMQMGVCLTSPATVSLDEMLSSSIQISQITDAELEMMMGATRENFSSMYGMSFDQYKKSFQSPFDKSGVQDSLAQFNDAMNGLKPFLDQLAKTIEGIKSRIQDALEQMKSYGAAMTKEHQKIIDNQNLIKNHIVTIQAQKKIIQDCAAAITDAKNKIQELVSAIKSAQSNQSMFDACPEWLQTALQGL